jgi:CheY-like chemotaxis protein
VEKPLALIVEDNPQLNKVFSIALQDDFEIISVANGTLALETLKQISPLVLILDMNLPGANGEEILQFVRSQPHLSAVQVILATADSAKADEFSPLADLVLLKPISPLQLRLLAARISKERK